MVDKSQGLHLAAWQRTNYDTLIRPGPLERCAISYRIFRVQDRLAEFEDEVSVEAEDREIQR